MITELNLQKMQKTIQNDECLEEVNFEESTEYVVLFFS